MVHNVDTAKPRSWHRRTKLPGRATLDQQVALELRVLADCGQDLGGLWLEERNLRRVLQRRERSVDSHRLLPITEASHVAQQPIAKSLATVPSPWGKVGGFGGLPDPDSSSASGVDAG